MSAQRQDGKGRRGTIPSATASAVNRVGDCQQALANALIATYVDGQYGGVVWRRDLTPRVRRVDERRHLEPPLAIVAGRIDSVALMHARYASDGIHFAKDASSIVPGALCDPAPIKLADDRYLMIYKDHRPPS